MNTLSFNKDMTFGKLRRDPKLRKYKNYILYGKGLLAKLTDFSTLGALSMHAGWNLDAVFEGLQYLCDKDSDGNILHFVYPEKERLGLKRDVNVIHFKPLHENSSLPYLILAAGGAFSSVCSLVESYPTAKHFNQLGYHVFVLTYRAGRPGSLPMALDDLATAVSWIDANCESLGVAAGRYVIGGFSAGGALTALWGTENVGYAHYKLPRPLAMLPIYAVASNKYFFDHSNELSGIPPKQIAWFMRNQFGTSMPSQQLLDKYEVIENVTSRYPPCYICCCKDDQQVPPVNSQLLNDALSKKGIPSQLHIFPSGGHGFGCGKGCSAEEWIPEADTFIQSLL